MKLDNEPTILFDSSFYSPFEEEMKETYFDTYGINVDEEEFSEDDPAFNMFVNDEHQNDLTEELVRLGEMVRVMKRNMDVPEDSPNLMVSGTSGAWNEHMDENLNFYALLIGGTLTPLFHDPAEVMINMSRDIESWRLTDVDGDLVIEGIHHDGVATRTVRALDADQTQELLDWFEDGSCGVQPSELWETARKIEPEARYQTTDFEL